ncbi:MAG: response regulator [Planctomycetes bacterium]|nr:response regulator [Planctomycetota bacterium]
MSGYGQYRKKRGKATARRQAGARPTAARVEPAPAERKLTLLIVDDEEEILKVLERLFRRHFRVVKAGGGKRALEVFRAERPELILSDQRMRDMTGIEMLKAVKDAEPGTIRMLITGYSDIEAVIEAVNHKLLDRYITKPWENEQLLELVLEGARKYLRNAGVRPGDESIYF